MFGRGTNKGLGHNIAKLHCETMLNSYVFCPSFFLGRMAQELSRNRKSEPSESIFQEKLEPSIPLFPDPPTLASLEHSNQNGKGCALRGTPQRSKDWKVKGQEPKPEPHYNAQRALPRGNVGNENRNCSNSSLHARARPAIELKRAGATLF